MKRILLVALLLTACSGNPSLPDRHIDRPYTLPADTKTLSIGGGVMQVREVGGRKVTKALYPGDWEIPINENWTWELLTAVRHQFHHDATNTYGMRFGLNGVGYATTIGFFGIPAASLYYKHLYSANFALESELGGNYVFRTKDAAHNGWRSYLSLAPLFQLDDTKALSPGLQLAVVHQYRDTSVYNLSLLPADETRFVVPLSLKFSWRLSKQWEADMAYAYERIGHAYGFSAQSAYVVLKHYW